MSLLRFLIVSASLIGPSTAAPLQQQAVSRHVIEAGYAAKILCSGLYLSHRSPRNIIEEDLGLYGEISYTLDTDRKLVVVTREGAIAKAYFRPGLGCTLLVDVNIEELKRQARGLERVSPKRDDDALWPQGERVDPVSAQAGIDAAKLESALDSAFSEPKRETPRRTRAVVVVYRGRIVAERYAKGFGPDTRLQGWSMTKSVTHALVGILVKEGKLSKSMKAPVNEWSLPDDDRNAITLDHLLRMSSGLRFVERYQPGSDVARMLFAEKSAAGYAASLPLKVAPDSRWSYSSGTSNIVSRIVRRAVGGSDRDYFEFPQRALFQPIGMASAVIEPDASGTFVGSSYMYATARDWARFGQLYLKDGVWAQKRILPEGWVDYAGTPTPKAPRGRYGAHFWLNTGSEPNRSDRIWPRVPPDAFFASGFEGQSVVIIPSRELVVVRLGLSQLPGAWSLGGFLQQVIGAFPEPRLSDSRGTNGRFLVR